MFVVFRKASETIQTQTKLAKGFGMQPITRRGRKAAPARVKKPIKKPDPKPVEATEGN